MENNSLKIAVVSSHIDPVGQKHLLDWFNQISPQLNNFQLFVGTKKKSIPQAKNFKIYSKKDRLFYTLRNLFKFKKVTDQEFKIQPLFDYNPDIIHLLTSQNFKILKPILDKKKPKLITSFRGYDINVYPGLNEDNLKTLQEVFLKSDVLHFISHELKNTAVKLGAKESKCLVIHRSINLNDSIDIEKNQRTKSTATTSPVILLTAARLVWEKGYIYALEALAELKNKGYNFKYHIVGDGVEFGSLLFHIKRLNLIEQIVFLGKLNAEEVKKQMLNADIYIQMSLVEALSNSIIEASRYGLPVVSSTIGGIPEVVVNEKTGFLFDPYDKHSIADGIKKLIDSPELRVQMGIQGNLNIQEKFNRNDEIQKWLDLYNSLA